MDIKTSAIKSEADFSDCMKYRYSLVRDFGKGDGMMNFIMLNPSTANEAFNDPTVHRCEMRTIDSGYRYMVVTNIFAFRATDPSDMRASVDPIGTKNNEAIRFFANKASEVICAWGEHGLFVNRGQFVKEMLLREKVKAKILKLNKSGEPAHPLYLPKALVPSAWL
ncbi:MAG: DUF1643 domain-containing protein [Alphaproteobacteria bacterium]|nr:DUF1643 domain-containing protein [Alphaproteobacteria bacterium]